MQDPPSAVSLLAAVSTLLRDELLPAASGRAAFQLRVAANALDTVARELTHAPAADAGELQRLERLLGHTGALEALNWELCRKIESGEIGPETPGLMEHLRQVTLDKLKIDQPSYATYKSFLENSEGSNHGF